MATRYTLLYKGSDIPTPEVLKVVQTKVNILDSSRKTLLVESDNDVTDELACELPDWVVEQEQIYDIPTTEPDIKEPF